MVNVDPFVNVDIKNSTIEELKSLLSPMLKELQLTCPKFEPGMKLFRIRTMQFQPTNISEIGPPPSQFVTTLGRLNDIGESVGYFSASRRSAYFEVRPKPGDRIVLSRWVSVDNLILLHLGYKQDAFAALGSSRNGTEYEFIEQTRSHDLATKEKYDFLSSELTKVVQPGSEWRYKTSIAIAKHFLGEGPQHGIMYPSIAMRANTDNIALKRTAFNRIQLVSLEYHRIKAISDSKIEIEHIDSSTSWDSCGHISWSNRPLHWQLTNCGQSATFKEHDGEWIELNEDDTELLPC